MIFYSTSVLGNQTTQGTKELHCKKKASDIPVPSRDVTYQNSPLAGQFNFFPARQSSVSDIPAGDRNVAELFLQCRMDCTSITFDCRRA